MNALVCNGIAGNRATCCSVYDPKAPGIYNFRNQEAFGEAASVCVEHSGYYLVRYLPRFACAEQLPDVCPNQGHSGVEQSSRQPFAWHLVVAKRDDRSNDSCTA